VKLLFSFLSFYLLSYGAVANLQIGDATRQQGVLSFNVVNSAKCTVTVYSDAALKDKVEDTNNAVFPGSESCVRPFNLFSDTQVTAVIGRRTSEQASDGKLHSRSLEINHTYYVQITDLTDGSTGATTFTTGNIPWGDTHVELPSFNANAFGQWGYPDLDWSDAGLNKLYVDPLSGLAFKRLPRQMNGHGGQWEGNTPTDEFPFGGYADAQHAWTNPSNVLNTSAAGPFASYTGTAQAPMVLFFRGRYPDGSAVRGTVPFDVMSLLEDTRANLYGSATATGNAEDSKVLMCLVVNYNPAKDQCLSPEMEVTLPAYSGKVSKPDIYPAWQFAGWNVGRYLTQRESAIFGGQKGTANVDNSTVTLGIKYDTDTLLSPDAAPGMKVNIDGTWYTIAAISSASRFTLVEGNVAITDGYWYMGNFGVRIRKKTRTSNAITLAATYSIAWSGTPSVSAGSGASWCNLNDFSVNYAADGVTPIAPKTGRLCMIGEGIERYMFLMAEDGETRYLSPVTHQDVNVSLGSWSPADPYTLFGYGVDDTFPSEKAIYEVKYDITCQFKAWPGDEYNLSNSPPDCLTWTNKTPHSQGVSVTQQIAAAVPSNPIWDPSFSATSFHWGVVINKYAVLIAGLHDSVCWAAVFDMSNFTLIKIMDSFSGTWGGLTFAACHSDGGVSLTDGKDYATLAAVQLAGQQPNSYLGGPFILPDGAITAKSLDGGATWDSDTSLAPGTLIPIAEEAGRCGPAPQWTVGSQCVDLTNAATVCGANSYGVTGSRQCVKLKIATDEVCSGTFSGPDADRWPCSWHSGWTAGPLRIGENTYISRRNGSQVDGKVEKFHVLSKIPDGTGGWIMEVQRWSTCDNPTSDPNGIPPSCSYFEHLFTGVEVNTHPNGWSAYVSATWAGAGVQAWYNLPGATTTVTPETSSVAANHSAIGLAPDGVRLLQVGYDGFMASRVGVLPEAIHYPADHIFEIDKATFAGITRTSDSNVVEEYPSLVNQKVPGPEGRGLLLDFRHIDPDSGYYPEKLGVGVWNHKYTLVPGQQYTYKTDIFQDLGNHKEWRPVVVSAGGIWLDISGPGALIDDTKPWTFCYAYKANECRPGAAAGDLFVVAKNAHVEFGQCIIGTLKLYTPCVTNLWPYAAWVEQRDTQRSDPTGNRFRRFTMGLVGPAAQYMYNTPHPVPDHSWMFIRSSWANGVRNDALAYRIPPPAADDGIDRSNYIPVSVKLPAGSRFVRIRFGYAENGPLANLFCTTRQEGCLTDSQTAPFAFERTDALAPQDCRSGCTVNIPALSGRVLYYRIESSTDGATNWTSGPIQAKGIQ
jgi:hypothetical protein